VPNAVLSAKRLTGTKQTKGTIEKRIRNTDQAAKQKTVEENNFNKYGVKNVACIDAVKLKIGKSNKGKKCPRTAEHQSKIIESKRKNGTLKHRQESKDLIKNNALLFWQCDDPPVTLSENKKSRYDSGKINNIFCRSSYEKLFVSYCVRNSIKIESAENKRFRVPYYIENKRHFYYPDFYLPEYGMIIEIKPLSMIDVANNTLKAIAAMLLYDYALVTEEELNDLDEFFRYIK
jgi:hypothetical protein